MPLSLETIPTAAQLAALSRDELERAVLQAAYEREALVSRIAALEATEVVDPAEETQPAKPANKRR